MQTVESLRLLPVWLNPGHLVASARVLMAGHGLKAIGVLDGDRLVGVVSIERIAGLADETPVREVMELPHTLVEADTPVRRIAEMFVEQGLERSPVMKHGKFVGIVTAAMLLRELRRSWDPLTGLSWSDALREWGMENLRAGREIVVLFVDLNHFGAYNKRYGHIVGDKVLQRVAELLREHVDEGKGVLVRYGGDEFAIGLIGTQEDGRELVEILKRRQHELVLPEAEEPVTYCIGMAGGKRTREREHTHYAATLDNLINLASQECIAQKRSLRAEGAAPVPAQPQATAGAASRQPGERVKVLSVVAEEHSPTALTQVVLGVGDCVVSGVHARMGRPVLESIAMATGKALERAFPGSGLEPQSVALTEAPTGERLVTVLGHLQKDGAASPASGVRTVGRDLYLSVAEATVDAYLTT